MHVVTLLRFEQHAFGRPFHAARTTFAPRAQDSDLHWHADFCEFTGVTGGNGVHLLDNGSQDICAGDVLFVRPHDRHAFRGTGPHGLEFVNLAFPASIWHSFVDLAHTEVLDSWGRGHRPRHFRLEDAAAESMRQIFSRALDRFYHAPGRFDLLRFWTDLLPLMADLDELGQEPPEGERRPEWFANACAAMRQEENLRLGVARLLELAAVSPAHLSRSMRRYHGCTPTEYVTSLRLEHAASLLATTNDPITGIAHRCGFSSQSYFSRSFRRAHQVSPREFRYQAQRALVP